MSHELEIDSGSEYLMKRFIFKEVMVYQSLSGKLELLYKSLEPRAPPQFYNVF